MPPAERVHGMKLQRCYRFRLEPTPEQEQAFRRFAGCRRYVWNWGLSRKIETYQTTGTSVGYHVLRANLVELKRIEATEFLKECHSQVLQETLRDLDRAFINFYEKRSGFPKKKSRKGTPHAFRISQGIIASTGCISVPKIGLVKARLHREMEGTIKSATIKQSADGHWHVTFVSHFEKEETEPTTNCPCGIDMGLDTFATFDDGEKVAAPRFYRRSERKLKRLHRQMSRCRKGSRNRGKARKRLARGHAKVRNQRNDWLHKRSLDIVSRHDTVCIEDLNIRGLVRTKLAKSFSDAAHGIFARMLVCKGLWYGCQVVKVDRFFASSKTCFDCGHKQPLELSDRRWSCSHCGSEHDRDINAARNNLREGLRTVAVGHTETLTACGEGVRLATASDPR